MKKSASFKLINTALWVAQSLLAICLAWSSYMKLSQPVEKLSSMWSWTAEVSPLLITFTAIVDLCAALGLTLPSLLHIQPRLTLISAVGLILLMICASVFHILRGETAEIGPNIIFAMIAVFIIWGRSGKDRY